MNTVSPPFGFLITKETKRNLGLRVNLFCVLLKDYTLKMYIFLGSMKCTHKFAALRSAAIAHISQHLTTYFWLEVKDREFLFWKGKMAEK